MDEGLTWTARTLTPNTIDPQSLLWNPTNDQMAVAHDRVGDQVCNSVLALPSPTQYYISCSYM